MTVAALPSTIAYLENGVSSSFAVPFRYTDPSDLQAVRIASDGSIAALKYGVDFTATAGDTDAGGELTPTVLSSGTRLLIKRVTPRAQGATYTTGDRFPAATTEDAFDLAMLIAQEQADKADDLTNRAFQVPVGETVGAIPALADRQGLLAVWAPDGGLTAVPSFGLVGYDVNVVDDGLWNATDSVIDDGAWG